MFVIKLINDYGEYIKGPGSTAWKNFSKAYAGKSGVEIRRYNGYITGASTMVFNTYEDWIAFSMVWG